VIIRCIDFETTGLPPEAGVVEVGWTDVTVTANAVLIGESISLLCNPGRPIEPGAAEVHGITDDLVADEIPAVQAMAKLMEGPDVFCAHFAQFERNFFGGGDKPWICSCLTAQHLYPDFPNHKNGNLPGLFGLELDPVRSVPLHRAAPDTYVTASILAHMLERHAASTGSLLASVEAFIALTKKPRRIDRMPFGKHRGTMIKDLPDGYLRWAIENMQAKDVAAACKAEMKRRAVPA